MAMKLAVIVAVLLGVAMVEARPYKDPCGPGRKRHHKLSKSAMIQRSMKARAMSVAKVPDPGCKTGVISLAGEGPDPQVCCPAYCGECSDYPDCSSVRGMDSKYRCCASAVMEHSCDHTRTPANVCIKACKDAVPPCIMAAGEDFEMPEPSSAGNDCGSAEDDWMTQAQAGVEAAEGGEWSEVEKKLSA